MEDVIDSQCENRNDYVRKQSLSDIYCSNSDEIKSKKYFQSILPRKTVNIDKVNYIL